MELRTVYSLVELVKLTSNTEENLKEGARIWGESQKLEGFKWDPQAEGKNIILGG